VDPDSIERIRSATFPIGRRGYDKREVDRFLISVADWLETGGADQSRSEVVRRELELVGEETSKVLTEAHDVAEKLRLQAEREVEGLTEGAQAQADRTRAEADRVRAEAVGVAETAARKLTTDADAYATQTRTNADRDAEQSLSKARSEAKRIVEEASDRKQEMEKVIADLETRRDEVLDSLERLSTELAGTATQHAKATAERAANAAAKADAKATAERAANAAAKAREGDEAVGAQPEEEEKTRTMPASKDAGDRTAARK
jgi:DivIVA domain-containing protein